MPPPSRKVHSTSLHAATADPYKSGFVHSVRSSWTCQGRINAAIVGTDHCRSAARIWEEAAAKSTCSLLPWTTALHCPKLQASNTTLACIFFPCWSSSRSCKANLPVDSAEEIESCASVPRRCQLQCLEDASCSAGVLSTALCPILYCWFAALPCHLNQSGTMIC